MLNSAQRKRMPLNPPRYKDQEVVDDVKDPFRHLTYLLHALLYVSHHHEECIAWTPARQEAGPSVRIVWLLVHQCVMVALHDLQDADECLA